MNLVRNDKQKKLLLILLILLLLMGLISIGIFFYKNNKIGAIRNTRTISNGYFEIPGDVSYKDALNPDAETSSEILKAITESKKNFTNNNFGVVLTLTKNGKEILPNIEKNKTSSTATVRAADMENVNKYVIADPPTPEFETWSTEERVALEDVIRKGYDLNKEVLGPPAFSDTVYIYKQNGRGYYSTWGIGGKTIVVPSADPGTLVHEMAHSFSSDYIFFNRAWEEGKAMLVQDIYSQRYLGIRNSMSEESYSKINNPLISTINFYSDSYGRETSVEPITEVDHYLMSGFVAAKAYVENKNGYKVFLQSYYAGINDAYQNQRNFLEEDIRDIFVRNIVTIEGQPSWSWLDGSHIMRAEFNESSRLAYIGNKIFFWQRDRLGYETIKYPSSNVNLLVEKLDGTQVISTNLTTDQDGIIEYSLFGKIPVADFYRVKLTSESSGGVVASNEQVVFEFNNKLENPDHESYVMIGTSGESITVTDGLGNIPVSSFGKSFLFVPSFGKIYQISKGTEKIILNYVSSPVLISHFLWEKKSEINTAPTIKWTNPSDPEFIVGGTKSPELFFSNNEVAYEKPYINLCSRIEGSFYANSVKLNGQPVEIRKNEFCRNIDLKNGKNEFEITLRDLNGNILSSKRTINKTGNATGSINSLPNLFGFIEITNELTNGLFVGSVRLYSENKDLELKDAFFGVNINGTYYKPNLDLHDPSLTASFYKIDLLKNSEQQDYKQNLTFNLAEYPFVRGQNRVCLVIDPLNKIEEINEEDNNICKNIYVSF